LLAVADVTEHSAAHNQGYERIVFYTLSCQLAIRHPVDLRVFVCQPRTVLAFWAWFVAICHY
jgi:hypothetical protein